MAQTFSISVALPIASGRLDAGAFPSLSLSVQAVAEEAHARWQAYAAGASLPSGKSVSDRTGKYARSISLRQTGDFAAEVFSGERVAREIEEGTPSKDLKDMLKTSRKTRQGKKGRFLVIPFRWDLSGSGAGQAVPPSVANWWKGQATSRVAGWTERTSATGHTVPQRLYNWGSSLEAPDLKRLGVKGQAAKNMRGMVSFKPQSARSAGGASKGGGMTFRTMGEWQTSKWLTKPKPGLHVAATVAEQVRPLAQRAFAEAVEKDLGRLFKNK